MKNPIKVGVRYQRSESERHHIAMKSDIPNYGLITTFDEFDKVLNNHYLAEPDIILVLEVFYHTSQGDKLRGDKSFRAKILTPKGRICYLYGTLDTWEEVDC